MKSQAQECDKNLGDRDWIGCNMMIMVIIIGQSCVTSDVFGWFLFRVRLFEILRKVVLLNMIERKSMEVGATKELQNMILTKMFSLSTCSIGNTCWGKLPLFRFAHYYCINLRN